MSQVRIEHPDAICLRCRRPFQPDHQARTAEDCCCRVPVPSENGETPAGAHESTDFREIERVRESYRAGLEQLEAGALGSWG